MMKHKNSRKDNRKPKKPYHVVLTKFRPKHFEQLSDGELQEHAVITPAHVADIRDLHEEHAEPVAVVAVPQSTWAKFCNWLLGAS